MSTVSSKSVKMPEIKWEDEKTTAADDDLFGEASAEQESTSEFADLLAREKTSGKRPPAIFVGQKIAGKVLLIHPDHNDVMVDLGGGKLTGVIEKSELFDAETGSLIVQVGDAIEAFVVSKQGDEVLLSYKMNAALKSLEDLEMAQAKKIPVKAKVLKAVKGGFEVSVLGKVGFCPISKIDSRFVEGGQDYVGKDFEFLVEKVEGKGRNIVLNRSALLKLKAEEKARQVLESLKGDPEKIWTGTVKELRDFGAFIDIGGVDGLCHVSELAHGRVAKASDVVSVGTQVQVKVLKVEQDAQGRPKISLSMKATSQDPWERIDAFAVAGKTYSGTVVNLMPFGAFVELAPGIEGLVHVSEMSWTKRIHHPSDVLKIGEKVTVLVKEVDRAHKRIGLTMKAIDEDPWHGVEKLAGAVIQGTVERLRPFGAIVTLKEGLSGLVPLSTLKKRFGEAYKQPATPGKTLEVQVLEIDQENRKVLLSLTGLEGEDDDRSHYAAYLAAEKAATGGVSTQDGPSSQGAGKGATSQAGTFGALLSAKLQQKK